MQQWRSEGVRGCGPHRAALARGGNRAKIKKKSRENPDCKFHMCLRLRAIKRKHYSQRVAIVGYNYNCSAITFGLWPRPVQWLWLKWFCEAGGSPDEARLEQTPYPFQPH